MNAKSQPEKPTYSGGSIAKEGELALRRYLSDMSKFDLISPEREIELANRIKQGDQDALHELVTANLRLVVTLCVPFQGLGVPILDLINEGNIGLMKAAQRFDPGKGAKMATYAVHWIRQAIRRCLDNQGRTIRVPGNALLLTRKLSAHCHQMAIDSTMKPGAIDHADLAARVGVTEDRVKNLLDANKAPWSLDDLLSPGMAVGEREPTTIGDITPDPNAAQADEECDVIERCAIMRGAIAMLDVRELSLITKRFGLDGGDPWTLDQLGALFGFTRERARQIESMAIGKLRKAMDIADKECTPEERTALLSILTAHKANDRRHPKTHSPCPTGQRSTHRTQPRHDARRPTVGRP